MTSADDLLDRYKRVPFAKGLLPFLPAVEALTTDFANICAKPDGRQHWVVCEKLTGEPAMFSHAAFYAEGTPPETGNYVPGNEEIPGGVDLKVVQRRANSRCFYTYVFDTYVDISLYEGQWALDDYMGKLKGFNPTNLPRRAYQSGQDPKFRSRFWMQTPMFLQRMGHDDKVKVPDHLHPWVAQAEKQSKVFRANPDRPRIWMLDGDTTAPVGEREYGPIQRGDVVAMSFTVTYHLTRTNWFPQFHLADIVILRMSDGDPTDYSAPTIDLHSRPPPSILLEEGPGGGPVVTHATESAGGCSASASQGAGVEPCSVAEERAVNGGPGDVLRVKGSGDTDGTPALEHKRSSDTLRSSAEVADAGSDEFELVAGPSGGEASVVEQFLDVVAEEVKVPVRGSGGKVGRAARKRL